MNIINNSRKSCEAFRKKKHLSFMRAKGGHSSVDPGGPWGGPGRPKGCPRGPLRGPKSIKISKDADINLVFIDKYSDIKCFRDYQNKIYIHSKYDLYKKPLNKSTLFHSSWPPKAAGKCVVFFGQFSKANGQKSGILTELATYPPVMLLF